MQVKFLAGMSAIVLVLASCGDSPTPTEAPPPRILRMEAITPTSLTGVVGDEVDPVPAVRVTDDDGVPVADIFITFRLAGLGHLEREAALTDANGVATVARWTLGVTPHTATVSARAQDLPEIHFTASALAGPVAKLVPMVGDEQVGNSGEILPELPTVRVSDRFSNPLSNVPVLFEVLTGNGTLERAQSLSDAQGIASPGTWRLGPAGGAQQIAARTHGLSVLFNAQACDTNCQGESLLYVREGRFYKVNMGGVTRLFAGDGRDREPSWSRDGTRVAFTRLDGNSGEHVYVMNADGSDVRRIATGFHSPSWAPDHRTLVVAQGGVYQGALFLIDTEDSLAAPRPIQTMAGSPAWSPDGTKIGYVALSGDDGYHALHLVDPDGSNHQVLTQQDPGGIQRLSWSPDGKSIAYSKCLPDGCDVYVVDVASRVVRKLTNFGQALMPDWSQDGSKIALVRNDGFPANRIALVDATTGSHVAFLGTGFAPAWIPRPTTQAVRR
jgi:hypothetical protein